MNRCEITFKLWVVVGLVLVSCQPAQEKAVQSKRPNIVFIMTDDHAYQAISAYGSNLINTPNIDRLAQEGMRFDKAFVTNSICSPSRAVILTGKHSHINGLRDNIQVFDSSQQTLPKLMQAAGYETAMIGKWHLKSTPTGFDFWKVLPGQGHYYHPEFRTPGGVVKETGYVTDVITDIALEWLGTKRDQEKPFMLMYQHKAPHREWWPAQNHLSDIGRQTYPEPPSLFDDYQNRGAAAREAEMRISDHMGLTNDNKIKPKIVDSLGFKDFLSWYSRAHLNDYNRMSDEEKANWEKVYGPINENFKNNTPQNDALTSWKYQRYMQDYLTSIRSVDENVGRLLQYLDSTGLAENTLVVYTSDQGFYLGEHGWFDKRFMYEESFRTPLIVRWPGKVKAGSINNNLVQNLDFAETFLEAVGAEIPGDMQGKSLLPLLTETSSEWRKSIYYHYYEYPGIHAVKRHYGVRTDRYKLIHFYHDIDEWELYDLEKDPHEMNNVFEDDIYFEVRQDMTAELRKLQEQYQDSDELAQQIMASDLDSN
ncbi:sulfatase [Fulvivirgaceae bacterium BMA12]|uniref:Sulfatase n=1 Tax=Agaribacillus aureus TaxID=3051825 RepID=A0ABT8L1A3_9BACT|nr:sulfatase [Fulvivirgaceae bacterium BMA12]